MFGTKQTPAMSIAKEIAEAFRTLSVKSDLQGHGISTMMVIWRGKDVRVSWYSSGNPDDIIIGGDRSFPKGPESETILKAAKARADGLLQERLTALATSTK